jgi:outer membrane protein assembly factor BamA
LLSFITFGCTVIKHYPTDKPFFFENSIKINGSLSKQEKIDIKNRLFSQIEDSAQIKVASKIPWPSFPWLIPSQVMDSPAVYNKQQVLQSVQNMTNSMSSIGYRRSSILLETDTILKKNQQRVKTSYVVESGPLYKVDSIVYNFEDTALNSIVKESTLKSIIYKGKAFDYFSIDQEINRLIELFQNNGYYKISKEDIIAEVDTNYVELLDPMLDAIEYARALAQVMLKRDKPEVDLIFRMRKNIDSNHYYQYRVGQFVVYPDIIETDTLDEVKSDSSFIIIKSLHNTFNSSFIKDQVLLEPGELYKRENYSKTLNNFNKLGAWQNINLSSEPDDEKRLLNYILQLQPAKRQFFGIDMEGSSVINNSQLIQVGSGRVGIATNFTLRNRNIGKRAIQLENNLRTGVEFNNFKKLLSGEITLTNRVTFPWLVAPVGKKIKSYFQQARTIASADISYINRFKFFQLNTFNTFLGYEWKRNPNTTWQFRPLNLEYTQFRADSLFLESIKNFPLLNYTYNNGLLIGMNVMYNRNLTPSSTKHLSLLKIYAEESGLTTGAVFYGLTKNGKVLSDLYRFFKIDAEFKHIINSKKNSLHFRAFAGAGFALTTGSRKGQVTLPFFKSYIAGGPNSMRGWSIRKLGIGSNIFYDTVAAGTFNDKYADVKLEGNIEYRFDLFQFYGFWMRGALFTDVGNIWFKNDLDGTLKNAGLKLKNLGRDLAVASGFGARVDFNYFLLRFDLGFPVKDPRYGPLNTGNPNILRYYSTRDGGWFVNNVWNKPTFQFALGYPF